MDAKVASVLSGLVVFAAGLLAFLAVVSPESPAEPAAPQPDLPVSYSHLEPGVEAALIAGGEAWIADVDELPGVPASVIAVLDDYQVPLMVPAS